MNSQAINLVIETGMAPFMANGVMNWRAPGVTEALARLMTAQELWAMRNFTADMFTLCGKYRNNLKVAAKTVADALAYCDRLHAAASGADRAEYAHLIAQKRDMNHTPHPLNLDGKLAAINLRMAEIEARS